MPLVISMSWWLVQPSSTKNEKEGHAQLPTRSKRTAERPQSAVQEKQLQAESVSIDPSTLLRIAAPCALPQGPRRLKPILRVLPRHNGEVPRAGEGCRTAGGRHRNAAEGRHSTEEGRRTADGRRHNTEGGCQIDCARRCLSA
eukprot:364250-Chlamydomonas_euryale.AAC.2